MRLSWALVGVALLGCGRSEVHPPPTPGPAPCDGRSHLVTRSHGVRDVRLAAGDRWGIAWAVNEPDGAHGGRTGGMETEVRFAGVDSSGRPRGDEVALLSIADDVYVWSMLGDEMIRAGDAFALVATVQREADGAIVNEARLLRIDPEGTAELETGLLGARALGFRDGSYELLGFAGPAGAERPVAASLRSAMPVVQAIPDAPATLDRASYTGDGFTWAASGNEALGRPASIAFVSLGRAPGAEPEVAFYRAVEPMSFYMGPVRFHPTRREHAFLAYLEAPGFDSRASLFLRRHDASGERIGSHSLLSPGPEVRAWLGGVRPSAGRYSALWVDQSRGRIHLLDVDPDATSPVVSDREVGTDAPPLSLMGGTVDFAYDAALGGHGVVWTVPADEEEVVDLYFSCLPD